MRARSSTGWVAGRPGTTAGSKPISIIGRPTSDSPRTASLVSKSPAPVPDAAYPTIFHRTGQSKIPVCHHSLHGGTLNHARYDAEGRITCVVSVAGGGSCTSTTGTHYGYNADGLRVARYSGTTLTNQYLYNTQGQMVTELDGGGGWQRGEVYVRGMYVATYENGTTTFTHTDWLGTVRYRSNLDGSVGETCTNLPFGDSLTCAGRDSSHKHFTGKLRDDDTGLDYFGARYYAGLQGRFLTPDWSASPAAVPYGDFANPQSLNLYAYVDNNPATGVDPDGHLVEINYDGVPGSASQDGAYGGDPSFFKAYVGDEWQRIMAKCMLDRDQQQQAQKAAQKQNGQQEKWNHNIVLKGQAGDAAGASHVILWVPYTLKDGKLDKPLVDAAHPENSSDPSVQVSLKESIKGGPFVNKGTSSGHGCDSLTCMGSGFTSPVNQHWYVNGERVQLVMGSDPATGKPHLTWEVHVTREVEGPRYFPVGQGDQ